ncbi:MAG: AMP-binding protein, partial [Bacteroidia bacterium]
MSAYSFLNHIEAFGSKVLFKRAQTELTYNQFAKQVEKKRLTYKKIGLAHKVIALKIENTEDALSSFLALASIQSIIVPFYKSVPDNITVVIEATIEINSEITFNESTIADECINELRKTNSSGLIISTSGTSGSPKWIVHRFDSLLSKYIHLQKPIIVPLVYQLDNISGIETFTSVACGGGTLICLPSNTPQQFAHNLKTVDLAPNVLSVTPSFLKLVILANGHKLLPGINRVNLGGEKLTRQDLELFQKGFSKAQIFSFY